MKNRYTLAIFYSLFVFNFLAAPNLVFTQSTNQACRDACIASEPEGTGRRGDCIQACDRTIGNVLKPGLGGAAQRLGTIGGAIGQTKPLEEVIGGIISAALAIVGVIFLALTVYGGYLWMLAREDEEQAKKAMQIIKMAVIGLAVVLSAYAITYFVVSRLTGATTELPS